MQVKPKLKTKIPNYTYEDLQRYNCKLKPKPETKTQKYKYNALQKYK